MSGVWPETPEELHMLAGEYVLGVLESVELRTVDRQATIDPRLAHSIAIWERRLAPMLTAVSDVAPPDALWARIEHAKSLAPREHQDRLPSGPAVARPPAAPAWPRPATAPRVWPWKVATVASLALAAGLAAIVLMPSLAARLNGPILVAHDVSLVAALTRPENRSDTRQDSAAQMAADTGVAKLIEPQAVVPDLVPAAGQISGFLAAAWPDGTVVLTAFMPLQVPDGKTLELWIKPPNAKAPRSLGVLTAAGRQVTLPAAPVDGTELSVSLEPVGGSRTGTPIGHIAYAGMLWSVRR